MIFLIVFICCAVELTYVSFASLRRGQWALSWHNWLADRIGLRNWLGRGSLFVSFALPSLLLATIFGRVFIDSTVLSLVGGIAVLLFCFGPEDLAQEIDSYTSNYLDDEGEQPLPDKRNFLNNVNADDSDPDRPYMYAIAIEANDRLFAPAFWFSVLGPVGALLFRMSSELKESLGPSAAEAKIAERLYSILIWLPARLLGFGLGLAGTLAPVMKTLREHNYDLSQSNVLLGDVAVAALGGHAQDDLEDGDQHVASINNMFSLIKHGFVVWLAVLGLLAAAGFA